jgi:hypothetical protein
MGDWTPKEIAENVFVSDWKWSSGTKERIESLARAYLDLLARVTEADTAPHTSKGRSQAMGEPNMGPTNADIVLDSHNTRMGREWRVAVKSGDGFETVYMGDSTGARNAHDTLIRFYTSARTEGYRAGVEAGLERAREVVVRNLKWSVNKHDMDVVIAALRAPADGSDSDSTETINRR